MQVVPLGDSALLIRFPANVGEPPESVLSTLLEAKASIKAAAIPGIIELTTAYTSVAAFYDPVAVIDAGAPVDDVAGWLEQQIRAAVAKKVAGGSGHTRQIEIPVCYEDEFAFDIQDVAKRAGLEPKEVIDLHCGAEYQVQCVGFTPGFPFLSGLPKKIATPRRDVPRTGIPAGSVAIGGTQTGIYPTASPGGWNVIGRTPLRLFDPQNDPPVLLRAGDRVRFRAITREEFERSIT